MKTNGIVRGHFNATSSVEVRGNAGTIEAPFVDVEANLPGGRVIADKIRLNGSDLTAEMRAFRKDGFEVSLFPSGSYLVVSNGVTNRLDVREDGKLELTHMSSCPSWVSLIDDELVLNDEDDIRPHNPAKKNAAPTINFGGGSVSFGGGYVAGNSYGVTGGTVYGDVYPNNH
jgi:hypothetical protein